MHGQTKTVQTRRADLRRAAGSGFQEQVASLGLQTGRVDKVGGLHVTYHLRRRVAGNGHRHGTVLANGKGLGIGRHHNRRFQGKAAGGDDLAVGVQVKSTVTGVGRSAIGLHDLEKTAAVDGHIQRLLGGLQATGSEILLRTDNTYPGTHLQARWQFAVLGGLSTRLAFDLVEQVLELGAITFEAGGRNVGQVVGNGGQVGVLCSQTRFCNPQCRKHGALLARRFFGAAFK